MFWSARASRAASGIRCSPERKTRPENRPSRKTSAIFSVRRSGRVTVTIFSTSETKYKRNSSTCFASRRETRRAPQLHELTRYLGRRPAALKSPRPAILAALREPASASALAQRLGLPRQRLSPRTWRSRRTSSGSSVGDRSRSWELEGGRGPGHRTIPRDGPRPVEPPAGPAIAGRMLTHPAQRWPDRDAAGQRPREGCSLPT